MARNQKNTFSQSFLARKLPIKAVWVVAVACLGLLLFAYSSFAIFGSGPETSDPAVEETQPLSPLSLSVEQDGSVVTAQAAGAADYVWKWRLIAAGQICDYETFDVAPNHPAVHRSNRLVIPEEEHRRNFYRNLFVCFQASAIDTSGRQGHALLRLETGNPLVSVVRRQTHDNEAWLQVEADSEVTYDLLQLKASGFGMWEDAPLEDRVLVGGSIVAGSLCERSFLKSGTSFGRFEIVSIKTGQTPAHRAPIEDDGSLYCFTVMDEDGNRSYIYADQAAGQIYLQQQGDEVYLHLPGTNGRVSWFAVGPLDTAGCSKNNIEGDNYRLFKTLRYKSADFDSTPYVLLNPSDHGKHYCFVSKDQFSNYSYRLEEIDVRGPLLTFTQRGSQLTVSADEPLKSYWLVGPLTEGEVVNGCRNIFLTHLGHRLNPLFYDKGRRSLTAEIPSPGPDSRAQQRLEEYGSVDADLYFRTSTENRYYCMEAADKYGNVSIERFRVLPITSIEL